MTSIRARLIASLLALFAVAAAAMGAVTYRNALAETEALFDYQLQQMALSLRDQGEIAAAQVDTLTDAKLDFVVQVWSVDGRSIYASRPHAALPTRAFLGLATLRAGGHEWRSFGVVTPSRVIQVAQPVAIRERLAATAAWRTVLPLLLLAPLAAVGLAWLASRSLRPLDALAAELRTRDAASLAPLVTGDGPDEIAPLAGALDALLGRLRGALEAQRAFVADAAHELRSPLTALKLQLELLRRTERDGQHDSGVEASAAADRRSAREGLAAGIDRATRLVNQLLALARSEPGAAPATRERVDLAALVRDVVAEVAASSRQSALELDAPEPVFVEGDPLGLALLARNLADNAVRHAPDAVVRVAVQAMDRTVTLTVDDAGPGIPEAERDRVFDRFYRRESDADNASGSGLGLAIVRNVVDQHGARIRLDTSPLGGLRVEVRFAASP